MQAHAHARDMGVDRDVAQAIGEEQHARGRLAPDAGQRAQVGLRLGHGRVAHPAQVERIPDRLEDGLDAHGLDLRDPARPDGLLDLPHRRVADGPPRREALAQAQEGDVAVAVVGRLREHGEDELADRVLVRCHDRHAVHRAQALAHGPHAAGGGSAPGARHARSIVLALMTAVAEHTETLHDQPLFWRSAEGGDPPVLYLHGVPTSSDDWVPFLERTGGLAPDLPGFGRSGKRGDLDFTMPGYDRFVEAFLDHLDVDRVRLVVHDWGVVGLLWAQRFPQRVERLVILNAVPLLPGYRWHRFARLWRTPVVGEVAIGLTTPRVARRLVPAAVVEQAWPHFDQGTQRAILRLFRT